MLELLCLTAAVCVVGGHTDPALPSLEEVIANVRANEELYKNLEFVLVKSYRINPERKDVPPFIARASRERKRVVLQGQYFLVEGESDITSSDGSESLLWWTKEGYDGDLTRRWFGSSRADIARIANIHHSRFESCALTHPHVWLLARSFVCFPLSTYFRGSQAVWAHESGGMWRDADLEFQVVGFEELDGLTCIKVAGYVYPYDRDKGCRLPGKPASCSYLWLAIERNYLPVRDEYYLPPPHNSVCCGKRRASDFKEIAPNLWLPHRLEDVAYDPYLLEKEGRLSLLNEEEVRVELVRLHPNYQKSFFSDISIPDGTTVYEFGQNGELLRNYTQGEFPRRSELIRLGWNVLWIVAALAALAFVGLVLVGKYRRRSREGSGMSPLR